MLSIGIVSDDVSLVTHSIEKLIALHVVLPARSTFMESGGAGIDYSKDEDPDWSAVQPVTSTFKPLFEDRSGVDMDCNGMHVDITSKDPCVFAATWKSAELIPTFYNIVARSVPRDSFRRQNTEASWLETVFVALAELAYSSSRKSSGNASGFIPLLEQLFIVVRARKINLSLHTFLTHAAYTGLLKGKENPNEVRWSLTTLLIDLGVDIFLPNSGFKDSSRLLDSLLQSLQHIQSDSTDKETYQTVKEKVVIPLLQAFATARDLPTFVGLWHEQLFQTEISRGSGRPSSIANGAYSVWEDDDLAAAYREAIKTTLSDTHLKAQIETAIPVIITDSGLISHTPESYASFVILEAGSSTWGQNGLPGLRVDLITGFVEAVNKSVATDAEKLHWSWRLWRLTRNLIPISLKTLQNSPNDVARKFEKTAFEVTDAQNILDHDPGSKARQEALEACRFLLRIVNDLDYSALRLESMVYEITYRICSLLNHLLEKEIKELSGWNGRVQDIETLSQLGTACVTCILEFPRLLSLLSSDMLSNFVKDLSHLAQTVEQISSKPQATDTTCVSFEHLWTVFTSYDYLVANPSLAMGTTDAICALLSDRPSFLLRFVPGIPVRISEVDGFKSKREAIMTKDGCPTESVQHVISLIHRHCQESQRVEPDVIEWITSGIPLQGSIADTRTIESFQSLLNTVFEYERKACKPTRVQDLLKRFYKHATSRVATAVAELESEPGNPEQSSTLTPVFVASCLRYVWKHHEELADSKASKDIKRQRDKIFKLLQTRLGKCNSKLSQQDEDPTLVAISLATTLRVLELFDDIHQEDAEIDNMLNAVEHAGVSADVSLCLQKVTRCERIARSAADEDLGFNDLKLLEGVDLHRMQAFEQQYFAREATAKLKRMNNTDRIKTIHELRNSGLEGGASGSSRLLLVGLAVSVLDEIAEKDSAEAREVSSLCTTVTKVLRTSNEIEQFSLAAECLDIILRLQPRGVSQFNIDNCLAAVTITISRLFFSAEEKKDTSLSPEFASTVYTRLCRLLGTIIGLYRQQLGGRFHVLIPALQSLLKALFSGPNRRKQRRGNKGISTHINLSVSHAVLFSRLLTSLCDPTTSAVSRPSRAGGARDSLVDQTKKAKVMAGQHLRILIASYAQNTLDTPLRPDIKTALAPGLYAVLDAMPRESKQALNASMDVSSRAIFKTLHEDYVRFGKWNSKG